ncbi:glycosyltransferase family 2 protein [Endothiovibrio diazotrophicus]
MIASRVVVIVPAHNEQDSVAGVVSSVRRCYGFQVVVVDDGSHDATAERAALAGARVIRHAECIGAWGAMQTGLILAAREGFELAITMDADGQHDPRAVESLLAARDASSADVVIGACTGRGGWARRLVWMAFRRLTGLDVRDLTSGFRLYGRSAIERLVAEDAAFLQYQDVGVLMLLRASGMSVVEVGVSMSPRLHGESKIFGSWMAVVGYLSHTLLLSACKWGRQGGDGRVGDGR